MIVVLGSTHDPVAQALAGRWPGAAVCGADDLTAPGWRWSAGGEAVWVVDGAPVPDEEVSGVFLRRSAVYPVELPRTHPDDREYLAAEVGAFLTFVLATTRALVVNPVVAGMPAAEALRPERWMAAAARLGVPVAPVRLAPGSTPVGSASTVVVEVVDGVAVDRAPSRAADAAVAVADALGLRWAAATFDDEHRLVGIGVEVAPSDSAADRLGRLLAGETT